MRTGPVPTDWRRAFERLIRARPSVTPAMRRVVSFLLFLALPLPVFVQGGDPTVPVILVYCPAAPRYGQALRTIIEEDGRFSEARVLVCEKLDELRATAFFPDVKAIVLSLTRDVGQELNSTLEWFFNNGGGLVGMGFASMWSASLSASQDVLPVFGNSYRAGEYDPNMRRSFVRFVKGEEDEISQGMSNFSMPHHRFILHWNGLTDSFEERRPESGEYKVLFAEQSTGAPLVIKYRDEGVSVTLATFGADDIERSPGYFGLFVDEPAFKTLFANSLYWVWTNEQKFQKGLEKAERFYQQSADQVGSLRRAAQDRESAADLARLLKNVLAILGGCIGSGVVYWLTFLRGPTSKPS